jgi:hypothetical protein
VAHLVETGIFPGGKGGRRIGLTTLPFAEQLEIWEPQLSGTFRACPDSKFSAASGIAGQGRTIMAAVTCRQIIFRTPLMWHGPLKRDLLAQTLTYKYVQMKFCLFSYVYTYFLQKYNISHNLYVY